MGETSLHAMSTLSGWDSTTHADAAPPFRCSVSSSHGECAQKSKRLSAALLIFPQPSTLHTALFVLPDKESVCASCSVTITSVLDLCELGIRGSMKDASFRLCLKSTGICPTLSCKHHLAFFLKKKKKMTIIRPGVRALGHGRLIGAETP